MRLTQPVKPANTPPPIEAVLCFNRTKTSLLAEVRRTDHGWLVERPRGPWEVRFASPHAAAVWLRKRFGPRARVCLEIRAGSE